MYRQYADDREYGAMEPASVKYRREQREPSVTRTAAILAIIASVLMISFVVYQSYRISEYMASQAVEEVFVNQVSDAVNEIEDMKTVKGVSAEEAALAVDAVKTISTYDGDVLADGSWAASVQAISDGANLTVEGGRTNLIVSRALSAEWIEAMMAVAGKSVVESAAVQAVSSKSDVDGTPYKVIDVKAVTTRPPKDGVPPSGKGKASSYEELYKVYMTEGSGLVRNIQRVSASEL